MGEAFIMGAMGAGEGATIQRITLTNATSLTIPLSNPKRSKCMVFGVYSYTRKTYRYSPNIVDYTYAYRCSLYGNTFDRKLTTHYSDYPTVGGNSWTDTEYEDAVSTGFFTRNASSITLTIGHIAETITDWEASTDTTRTEEVWTNSIDIYVVDYD